MSTSRNTIRGASKSRYLSRRIHRRGAEGTVKRPSGRQVRAIQRLRELLKSDGWSD